MKLRYIAYAGSALLALAFIAPTPTNALPAGVNIGQQAQDDVVQAHYRKYKHKHRYVRRYHYPHYGYYRPYRSYGYYGYPRYYREPGIHLRFRF